MDKISLRQSFGNSLVELAEEYKNFVVFDADVAGGTCTNIFRDKHPDRFIQCGIAEQNMMTAAAGYSTTGKIPFVTCYGVFACMRALEQARNGIAYPDYNVKIVASHLGIDVGPDGVSHQCIEDLAIYRSIPNMVVISPCDDIEMKQATEAILNYDGPVYMRTGRSDVPRIHDSTQFNYEFEIGKGDVIYSYGDICLIATGNMVHRAIEARKILNNEYNIGCKVINMSTIKPIDKELLIEQSLNCRYFVTCEDHNIHGGLFSVVLEAIADNPIPVKAIAINDTFAESGEPEALAEKYKIDTQSIVDIVLKTEINNRIK